jgi:hypothetical protein
MDRTGLDKVLDIQSMAGSLTDMFPQDSLVHNTASIPKVVSPMVMVAVAS